MSAQSVDLNCEICGYRSNTREVLGEFYYLYDNLEISINRVLGWCKQCDGFRPIENFGNQKDICERIESLINSLEKDYSQKKFLFIGKKLRSSRLHTLNHIKELNEQLKISSLRIGSEKCLTCGSSDIETFSSDNLVKIDESDGDDVGNVRTGFIHPNCGGEIIATPSPLYIQMEFTPRYYNPDGTKL